MRQGKVYLVGAGPGDPGLITVKGAECLKNADVVVYDRLIDPSLLELANPKAEKIFAGKTAEYHSKEQTEINDLLVQKAKEGKVVVRLKGGDPFIMGRGGEEAEALASNNVPFEVVPGVTSAIAVPAYAGIPLGHRDLSSSFAIITGHEATDKTRPAIAWDKVAMGADTLVFLMGVANLETIASELVKNGRAKSTPVAIIEQGTSPQQKTLVGTLENIITLARESAIKPPAVIVVGEVVRLREKLSWFDNRPLFGKRVLVTRATHQVGELNQLLKERGAVPVEMPLIQILPPESWREMDRAISSIANYNWVVFTSVNGVRIFFERLLALKLDARSLCGVKIGVIGPATAKAVMAQGLSPDYVPQEYTSEGFLTGFKAGTGDHILLPRADIATKELAVGLRKSGAIVKSVTVYRTVKPDKIDPTLEHMLAHGEIDVITFTSASTVNNFLTLVDVRENIKAKIACIGHRTAEAVEKAGFEVDIMAWEHTVPGLVEAMEAYFQNIGGRK